MALQLFKKTKQLEFERSYTVPVATTTIEHTNDITFTDDVVATQVRLTVTITKIGTKAKMAAFGMKWGYKAQLDQLDQLLRSNRSA